MPTIITPTPGRVVWYWPSQQEIDAKSFAYGDQTQPLAATVAYVHGDRLVNLVVADQNGRQFPRTSVQLIQDGEDRPHTSEGPFAEWMPYQLAAAKKDFANFIATRLPGLANSPKNPNAYRKWVDEDGVLVPTDHIQTECPFEEQREGFGVALSNINHDGKDVCLTIWKPVGATEPFDVIEAWEDVEIPVDLAAPGSDQSVETKVYTDGTSATGIAPLPDQSPAQQEAVTAAQVASIKEFTGFTPKSDEELSIKEGDTGLYMPFNGGEGDPKPSVNATVAKVWTDSCVNVETETGEQQTSVLVYRGTGERPAGHYFEPGAGRAG